MAELITLARPYAKAAFNYALEYNGFAEWSTGLAAAAAVVNDKKVKRLLTNPTLTAEQHSALVIDLSNDYFSDTVKQFIQVLAYHRRLLLLPTIDLLFAKLKAVHEQSIEVQVKTAKQLTEAQANKLVQSLTARLGKQVNLATEVNESLLGGVVIQAEDVVIDGSIRGRLAKLAETIQG